MTTRTPVRETIVRTIDGHDRAFTTLDLARIAYQVDDPTPAQRSATRRATAKLAADGRIERAGRIWSYQQGSPRHHLRKLESAWSRPVTYTATDPGGMACRRPLAAAERRRQRRALARLRARLAAL